MARADELAQRPAAPRARKAIIIVVAGAACCLILAALALAAHTRSSAPEPANPSFPAPPACASATSGSGVDCGPASAAIRTAGSWQVIDEGRCIDHTRLYFGVHTANGDAPLSLIMDTPKALAKGGSAQVIAGQLALVSGQKEPLSGQAVVAPGGKSGAFTVHGRDAQGRPDGKTYDGAWTCRAGHTPQHLESQQTAQAHRPSAIVWAGGRWQVVSSGFCALYDPHFGVLDTANPKGSDPHRTLDFFMDSYFPDNPPVRSGIDGVADGEIDVLGAHAALGGQVIVRRGSDGGAFDLNNRASPSSPDRVDYVGAWTCGAPNS